MISILIGVIDYFVRGRLRIQMMYLKSAFTIFKPTVKIPCGDA
jgi:hypothetical protein